jgi:peroxiredoxin
MGLVDLEKAAGGYTHHNLPVPATYIVSSDGTIRFAYVNPNYKVRLHPDVLVAAARTMPEYRLRLPKKD